MDYGRIISESFQIAWRYKSLWVFGLFAGGGFSFNLDLNNFPAFKSDFDTHAFGETMNFPLDIDWQILLPVFLLMGFMMLGYFIMHLISVPALIDGVNKIKRGGTYRFGSSFSAGVDFFLRYLGMILLAIFAFFVVIIVMVIAGAVSYAIAGWILLTPALMLMIPAFFVVVFIFTSVFSLALRAMVVRNIGIADSLEEGYWLFRHNLSKNLIMILILIGFSIGIGIALVIVWLIVGAPIALVTLATGAGLVPAIILAVLIGLPISLVVGGLSGTALQNFYTLFYFQLVEPGGQPQPAATPPAAPLT